MACDLVCISEGMDWLIGDGTCDDGVVFPEGIGPHFYCEEFDWDGGDCGPSPDDDHDGDGIDDAIECASEDIHEPNDTPATSHDFGIFEDGDGSDGDPVEAFGSLIDDATDVDWFTFHGLDVFGGVVAPGVEFAGDISVCLYADCDVGETEVECSDGSAGSVSEGGLSGCCSSSDFTIDLNCSGTSSDDAQVYLRIDSDSLECEPYSLGFWY